MQISRSVCIALMTLCSSYVYPAPFPGGGEALVSEATAWVSKETGYPEAAIEMSAPDRRVPIEACEKALRFRFPFPENQRTVEAVCASPSWKRFIRVKIDERNRVVAAARDLPGGYVLNSSDLGLVPYTGHRENFYLEPQLLIGLTLVNALSAGTIIDRAMVIDQTAIFVTGRAFEAGEVINREDLNRIDTDNLPQNALSSWPPGVVTASEYLESGQTLLESDIEQSAYVVVSATNIVRGQIITKDMIERIIQPRKQLGAQTLTSLSEAIGLEATRTIRSGSPLKVPDLTAADLVRKGEKVTLTITRGALTIAVDTIAREAGKMGEQIELTNIESGKVVRGIVSGRHQAKGIAP